MTLSCEHYHGHMASLLGGFEKAEETTTHELLLSYSRKKRSSTTVHVKPKRKDRSCEKACLGCGTVKTPLWRLGPSGPKTLCNACGIRYRKKMRKVATEEAEGSSAVARGKAVGTEVLKERQRRKQEGLWMLLQKSRKFARVCGEEEAEAAVLLMAMSSGLFLQS